MIKKDVFMIFMQDAAELYGWKLSGSRRSAIYFRLCEDGFLDVDVKEAFYRYEQDMFKFAEFQVIIRNVRAQRIEREAQELQKKEDEAIRKWFREHTGTRTECVNNYKCGQCMRTYCDIVALESTQGLKDMLSQEKPIDEIHEYLANKFQGIGFEKNVKGLEPF